MSVTGRFALGALACVALSACQVEVTLDTRLSADGSGTFSIAIGADEELRELREQEEDRDSIGQLFDGLAAKGWAIARSEPEGGLRIEASREFEAIEGFDDALAELRSVRTSDESDDLGQVDLELTVERDPGFLQTGSRFTGRFDTTSLTELDPALLAELRRLVVFEVRASLPGSPSVKTGDADLDGGTVVWRPQLGDAESFDATAVRRNPGAFLAVLLGAVSFVLFSAAFLARSRRARRRRGRRKQFGSLRPLSSVGITDPDEESVDS